MTKILSSLFLSAAIAGIVAASGLAVTSAQDKEVKEVKKDVAKEVKKDVAKEVKKDVAPTAKPETIEILSNPAGFRFLIRDAEGKLLVSGSPTYKTKEEAYKAIETLRDVLKDAKIPAGKKVEEKVKEKVKEKAEKAEK